LPRKTQQLHLIRFLLILLAIALGSNSLLAATAIKKKKKTPAKTPVRIAAARRRVIKSPVRPSAMSLVARRSSAKRPSGAWKAPTYADSTEGDFLDADDLAVRRAAVDALGPLNGTVVVSDPSTGRVLTIVNQKLAYQTGYQPCSTVKIPVALAALSEGVIDRQTLVRVYGRTKFDMTSAIAKSNNQYFANLGERLGFDRVRYYAGLFGLGEKAGLDIAGEQAGLLTPVEPKSGVGMMTSFGDGISLTPLEFAALMGAVANGGTLYYLQYPKTQAEALSIIPRVKRRLDIDQVIPDIKPGMMGAVEYGTARRIGFDPNEPIYGKTGTCTDSRTPTHLGWFGSFAEVGNHKLVVVVLLTGGKPVSGPAASGVAGNVYRNLGLPSYFSTQGHQTSPAWMVNN
jgi:cell division protein FtsI/penicillin-binding protein 2